VHRTNLLFFLLLGQAVHGQIIDSLNTAANCNYMKQEEKEMIYEINLLRSNPSGYIQYIQPMLDAAISTLRNHGKGSRNYSVSYSTAWKNGKQKTTTDTVWHYSNEEEVKALQSLVNDLKSMKSLSILQPDSGIYLATIYFAADQDRNKWKLLHTGTDGSSPWDRIRRFSPTMQYGNENGGGRFPQPTAKDIVIMLLIDSGIPGYGHRYNMLNRAWTHVACFSAGLKAGMYRWIQNFGAKGE
jgi:uncharacterized protein YkwD